jgi:hypothetical protein
LLKINLEKRKYKDTNRQAKMSEKECVDHVAELLDICGEQDKPVSGMTKKEELIDKLVKSGYYGKEYFVELLLRDY